MKSKFSLFVLLLFITSCTKIEDDSSNECNSNCTVLKGKFVTLNNVPLKNIKVSLQYKISGGGIGGGSIRKIVNTQSDINGNFNKNFFIEDSELGNSARGYFKVEIDDSNLDVNKYIRTNNLISNTTNNIGFPIFSIINRDTIIDNTFYFPKKAYIKVNLNEFVPILSDDYFEVQTFYPFGSKVGINAFLGSEYSAGFSGYGNWRATKNTNLLNVFVAEGENNLIRIFRRKNGLNTIEDIPIFIPVKNTIVLTYEF